jgi:hypothetical protein
VTVTGIVPDIRPYLRRATLAVAPVPYGAGIQNKVLEAMACGTSVVASPQAISALAIQPGRDLVVAEGVEGFARAVLALLDDPARRAELGQAGRAYVEAHHAWDAVAAQLVGIYQAAIGSSCCGRSPTAPPPPPRCGRSPTAPPPARSGDRPERQRPERQSINDSLAVAGLRPRHPRYEWKYYASMKTLPSTI